MKKRVGILTLFCTFCLSLITGVLLLFPNVAQKVHAGAGETPTTGSHTVTDVYVHHLASSGNGVFCYFTENSTVLLHDIEDGNTEENNEYLMDFAKQLQFNGFYFETTGVGGRLNTQNSYQNWFIEKTNGSTGTAISTGDYFLIPQGATLKTGSVSFTFAKNFKLMYTGSTTCPQTSEGVTCGGSGKCNHGFHVFAWETTTTTHPINTALLISAMTKTDGTVGIVPYYYNTQGYAVSFDMLSNFGAGFGVVIGNKTNITSFNSNGYKYLLFKQDGTTDNSLGYTGTFQYQVGKTYKFAVESGKLNLYEKGVLDTDSAYALKVSANFSMSSWDSIGFLAISDSSRSATAVVDNIKVYNQNNAVVVSSDCNGALPSGWGAANSNGKGTVEVYSKIMYSVSFLDANGNTLTKQQVCANGQAIAPASAPVVYGYEFTGWSDDYSVITANVAIHPTYQVIGGDSSSEEDSSEDSSEEESSSDEVSSEDSSEEESSSDEVSSEDSSEEESSSEEVSSEDSSEEESSSEAVSSEDSSEEESSSEEVSSEDSSEEESSSEAVSSEDSSEEESSSEEVSSEDSSEEESSSEEVSSKEPESEDISSNNSEAESSSSKKAVGGCNASITGIFPVLALLGIGLCIKGRKE